MIDVVSITLIYFPYLFISDIHNYLMFFVFLLGAYPTVSSKTLLFIISLVIYSYNVGLLILATFTWCTLLHETKLTEKNLLNAITRKLIIKSQKPFLSLEYRRTKYIIKKVSHNDDEVDLEASSGM